MKEEGVVISCSTDTHLADAFTSMWVFRALPSTLIRFCTYAKRFNTSSRGLKRCGWRGLGNVGCLQTCCVFVGEDGLQEKSRQRGAGRGACTMASEAFRSVGPQKKGDNCRRKWCLGHGLPIPIRNANSSRHERRCQSACGGCALRSIYASDGWKKNLPEGHFFS